VCRRAIGYNDWHSDYRLERGMAVLVTRFTGALFVPLNEIPKYLNPDMRKLVETALEDAWRELSGDAPSSEAQADFGSIDPVRRKIAGTIVALTAVGETDPAKLRYFALNAVKGLRKRR
jgi:hypothetical protein